MADEYFISVENKSVRIQNGIVFCSGGFVSVSPDAQETQVSIVGNLFYGSRPKWWQVIQWWKIIREVYRRIDDGQANNR